VEGIVALLTGKSSFTNVITGDTAYALTDAGGIYHWFQEQQRAGRAGMDAAIIAMRDQDLPSWRTIAGVLGHATDHEARKRYARAMAPTY